MLKKILRFLIIIIPISGLSYFIDENYFKFLIVEDGIYENLTALFLLFCSGLFFYYLFTKKNKVKYQTTYFLIMALLLFFGFGEEISWGQRIFNIETNEYFLNNNLQKETNLHNLQINGVKLNKLIFTFGLGILIVIYFLFLPLLYRRINWINKIIDKFGIHIPKLQHFLFFIIGVGILSLIPDNKKWELAETIFIIAYSLTLIDPMNSKESFLLKKNHLK